MGIAAYLHEPTVRMAPTRKAHLGVGVRRRRQARGMTQGDLASAAEIADETVSRIERGRLNPSVAMAERIATALETTLDELIQAKAPKERKLRPAEARLVTLVRNLSDTELEDVVRAVKILLAVGRERS